jgi:uncharacterized repeat protein (TIGR04076 family)
MAESFVRVKVISQKGHCEAGHKVGEKTPQGMCVFAFASIFPTMTPLMFDSAFPLGERP